MAEHQGQQFLFTEDVVRPNAAEQYEQALRTFHDELGKHEFEVSYQVLRMDNNAYFVMSPITALAGIDDMTHSYDRLADKVGVVRYMETLQDNFRAMRYQNHSVIYRQDRISHHPGGDLAFGVHPFVHWGIYYVKPSQNEDALKTLSELIALKKRKAVPLHYTVYTKTLGNEMPAFFVCANASDPAEMHALEQESKQLLGEEGQRLMARLQTSLRRFETSTGWERPELSYLGQS